MTEQAKLKSPVSFQNGDNVQHIHTGLREAGTLVRQLEARLCVRWHQRPTVLLLFSRVKVKAVTIPLEQGKSIFSSAVTEIR